MKVKTIIAALLLTTSAAKAQIALGDLTAFPDAAPAAADLIPISDASNANATYNITVGTLLTNVPELTGAIATGELIKKTAGGLFEAQPVGGLSIATSQLTGTLPVANGGTGLTALGTALQILRTNAGATAMEWADAAAGGLASTDINTFSKLDTIVADVDLVAATGAVAQGELIVKGAGTTYSAQPVSTLPFVATTDINTFSKLDTIVADETLAKASDIGATVQAYDLNLQELSGLTASADLLPYFDSGTTMDTTSFSAFGRSVIDDADAAAARTTLGAEQAMTRSAWTTATTTLVNRTQHVGPIGANWVCAALPAATDGNVTELLVEADGTARTVDFFTNVSVYRLGESALVAAVLTVPASTTAVFRLEYSNGQFNLTDSIIDSETANQLYAGPVSGGADVPGFRAMVAADIPNDLLDSQHYAATSIDNEHLAVDIITADEMADADHGDVSWSSGVAAVDNVAATATKPIYTEIHGSSHTISANECYGGVHYVTAVATITLPAAAAGMSVTIIANGANAVTVDPNASDLIIRDGTAQADGVTIVSPAATGDIVVLTYYDATGWFASSNSWTAGS